MPAFSGLLAPHWRDDARGALLGVSAVTSRAHIVRALLEAICWQARPLSSIQKSLEHMKVHFTSSCQRHSEGLVLLTFEGKRGVKKSGHIFFGR